MRERKSARLLVMSPACTVLLFRFVHKDGPLAGDDYWATPGGGVEPGETFEMAAIRELREETGIHIDAVGASIAERRFPLQLPCGEWVTSVEEYFVVYVGSQALSNSEWTANETKVIADADWWSAEALRTTEKTVWPENLVAMLERAGVFSAVTSH
ncbi:DNA mismatch repair protein MutT [Pseudomonas sp. SDI]|uniref:NUDIX hydrolase n=1 Tax=Pseudomonas sp. SDI TaxID=2170734 RepID=UPI000DE6B1AB|nr:NUDIX domain-containing protein [Pseudomonas sp. SDI]PWB32888.1 DNA mismatch repair protein MutT [Pseudomonas sp. SDI]